MKRLAPAARHGVFVRSALSAAILLAFAAQAQAEVCDADGAGGTGGSTTDIGTFACGIQNSATGGAGGVPESSAVGVRNTASNAGSAIGRGARGTSVWKSSDDGDTWSDETGDVVTNSPGPGVWYDRDFYFVTRGEGVLVKRNFEA